MRNLTLATYENVVLHEYHDGSLIEVSLPFSTEYAVLLKINVSPYVTMACSDNYLPEVQAEVILKSMNEFLTYSREHEATHGVQLISPYA